MKKREMATRRAKVAIVLDTTGIDETDLMEMIDDMLDGGLIQSTIYERAGVTNGTGKKFKITSATVEPTGDSATELQRDALAPRSTQEVGGRVMKLRAKIVRGDDGAWWIEVDGLDVIRGPYITHGRAEKALRAARHAAKTQKGARS